jgi:hypothetical protein
LLGLVEAGQPGIHELRVRREEMPSFTPFLPADKPAYHTAAVASA